MVKKRKEEVKYTVEEQKEHRNKWVSALRFGEYETWSLAMRYGSRYSCLGVACDISELGKWKEIYDGVWDGSCKYFYRVSGKIYDDDYQYRHLPISVQKWLGLTSPTGRFVDNNFNVRSLSDLDGRLTFEEIAYVIESEPMSLVEIPILKGEVI